MHLRTTVGALAGGLLLALTTTGSAAAQPLHFTACATNTGESASIVFPTGTLPRVDGTAFAAGDEVAVFTAAGLCVGMAVWPGGGAPFAFPVWGDNPVTPARDGLLPGETLLFRLWRRGPGIEVGLPPTAVVPSYAPCNGLALCRDDGAYGAGALLVLSALEGYSVVVGAEPPAPGDVEVGPLHPNPFRERAELRLSLGTPRDVSAAVFDLTGRRLITLFEGELPAGAGHVLPLDGADLPPGTYLVRVAAGPMVQTLVVTRR